MCTLLSFVVVFFPHIMSYFFLLLVLWTTFPVVWSQSTCVLTDEEKELGYVSEIYDSLTEGANDDVGWYAFYCGMCGYCWFSLIF